MKDRVQLWNTLKKEARKLSLDQDFPTLSSLIHSYYDSLTPQQKKVMLVIVAGKDSFAIERGKIPETFDKDPDFRRLFVKFLSSLPEKVKK